MTRRSPLFVFLVVLFFALGFGLLTTSSMAFPPVGSGGGSAAGGGAVNSSNASNSSVAGNHATQVRISTVKLKASLKTEDSLAMRMATIKVDVKGVKLAKLGESKTSEAA